MDVIHYSDNTLYIIDIPISIFPFNYKNKFKIGK